MNNVGISLLDIPGRRNAEYVSIVIGLLGDMYEELLLTDINDTIPEHALPLTWYDSSGFKQIHYRHNF
jgi:hypothetical protein